MRSVAILSGISTHLDHLGVLSAILEIPLIVTDEKTYQLAKRYYPFCNVALYEPSALSLDYLATSFDLIFETGRFFATELSSTIELLYGKKMRFVFCPHGHSEKGAGSQELAEQDIALIYGPHHHELLKETGALGKTRHVIETGNYRLPFYLEHKSFYDALVDQILPFKEKRPIVLYAPTWEASSSLFTTTSLLIQALEKDFNLLVKLHPYLFEKYPAQAYALMGRCQEHPAVYFLNDFPPIYPLLDRCAFYIGDYSSIGYDFLAYNRPLFFLPTHDTSTLLHKCGTLLSSASTIKEALLAPSDSYEEMRRQTYAHAFGQKKSYDALKSELTFIQSR